MTNVIDALRAKKLEWLFVGGVEFEPILLSGDSNGETMTQWDLLALLSKLPREDLVVLLGQVAEFPKLKDDTVPGLVTEQQGLREIMEILLYAVSSEVEVSETAQLGWREVARLAHMVVSELKVAEAWMDERLELDADANDEESDSEKALTRSEEALTRLAVDIASALGAKPGDFSIRQLPELVEEACVERDSLRKKLTATQERLTSELKQEAAKAETGWAFALNEALRAVRDIDNGYEPEAAQLKEIQRLVRADREKTLASVLADQQREAVEQCFERDLNEP